MKIGESAPDFELSDQDGTPTRLSELLADGPVALFFYPAALTPGCTKEACHFRDLHSEFASAGIQRIGISRDDVGKQKKFAEKHNFDYPLLSDHEGDVAKAFGAARLGGLLGLPAKRVTFAIKADGRIADIIASELDMNVHADRVLKALS